MRYLRCEMYRLYDSNDRLLYIGVSTRVPERMRQHGSRGKAGKPWWPEVAYCSAELFPCYADALNAERAAIKAERPLHNKRSALPPVHFGLGWPDTARGVVV